MIDHVWTVLCSRAVVDRDTNNVSIQNAIEQLNIVGEPKLGAVVPRRFEVVTFCVRAAAEVPCRGELLLTYRSPSDEILGTFERPINLLKHERLRDRMRFEGLPAGEPGRYYFDVELRDEGEQEWRRVAAIPLMIVFKPPEEEGEIEKGG